MKKALLLAVAVSAAPLAALAMPAVGDVVGTNPTVASAALEKAGCKVRGFEAEDGKIEAKCTDAEETMWEIYINPTSGTVTEIKAEG